MPRTAAIAAFLSLSAGATASASAQTHHVTAPEKVTRAVAVYEWTGDLSKPTASRLVPVSLFINGHFEDAGLYLARPVPFAIQPGDVYSVELAGDEKGVLDIEHARDFTTGRNLADVDPIGAWYAFGRFSPLAPPKPPPNLHNSAHPPVIVASSDPDRPHLSTKTDDAGAKTAGTPASSTPTKTPMGDDTDRPTLGRRTDTTDTDAAKDPTPQTSTGATPPADNDPERPTLRKRDPDKVGRKSPPQSGVTGPDRSLNDDPDRPIIGRRKAGDEETAELKSLPPDMHQVAAVSDAAHREPHLFTREWDSPAERADVLSHLQTLARTEVEAYLSVNHLAPGPIPTAPTSPPAAAAGTPPASAPSSQASSTTDPNAPTLRRTPGGVNTSSAAPIPAAPQPVSTTPKPTAATTPAARRAAAARARAARQPRPATFPLTLTAEQLNGYLLSYGGLPTFAYTAQVPVTAGGPVYVTLLAQRLPSGGLQLSLRSVTDASHLDRTPWMRPIDAVDPDASHRASILFELRAQTSRQFALYRVLSAQAEQEFLSQPIQ